jgi:hypothetical protein
MSHFAVFYPRGGGRYLIEFIYSISLILGFMGSGVQGLMGSWVQELMGSGVQGLRLSTNDCRLTTVDCRLKK